MAEKSLTVRVLRWLWARCTSPDPHEDDCDCYVCPEHRDRGGSVFLSDITIQKYISTGLLGKGPWDMGAIQPASIDLRLGARYIDPTPTTVDLRLPYLSTSPDPQPIPPVGYLLVPGDFVLMETLEDMTIPESLVGRVEGKSSLARLGLVVHTTAGWIDPGFSGPVTLELANVGKHRLILHPGIRIAQLSLARLDRTPMFPYSGRYQQSPGVTDSRWPGLNP